MNGAECDFIHNDPLKQLSYDASIRSRFLGEELDVNYRAALEVSRTGELSLRIPDDLPSDIVKPRPPPRGAPEDVAVQFEKLMKVLQLRNLMTDDMLPATSHHHAAICCRN